MIECDANEGNFKRFVRRQKRFVRFLSQYPSEVIWGLYFYGKTTFMAHVAWLEIKKIMLNLPFFYYPEEVIFEPFFCVYHWSWRNLELWK